MLNYMEGVPSTKVICINSFYLPHHPYVKYNVFNTLQANTSNILLNSVLHIGPKLQHDLMAMLLHYAFITFLICNIVKMFRQFNIYSEDTNGNTFYGVCNLKIQISHFGWPMLSTVQHMLPFWLMHVFSNWQIIRKIVTL